MKAVIYQKFKEAPKLTTVLNPALLNQDVVLKVEAKGVCRSDCPNDENRYGYVE